MTPARDEEKDPRHDSIERAQQDKGELFSSSLLSLLLLLSSSLPPASVPVYISLFVSTGGRLS